MLKIKLEIHTFLGSYACKLATKNLEELKSLFNNELEIVEVRHKTQKTVNSLYRNLYKKDMLINYRYCPETDNYIFPLYFLTGSIPVAEYVKKKHNPAIELGKNQEYIDIYADYMLGLREIQEVYNYFSQSINRFELAYALKYNPKNNEKVKNFIKYIINFYTEDNIKDGIALRRKIGRTNEEKNKMKIIIAKKVKDFMENKKKELFDEYYL